MTCGQGMVGSHSCNQSDHLCLVLGAYIDHYYSVTSPEGVALKDALLAFSVFCSVSPFFSFSSLVSINRDCEKYEQLSHLSILFRDVPVR